jgi:hypothetical protein
LAAAVLATTTLTGAVAAPLTGRRSLAVAMTLLLLIASVLSAALAGALSGTTKSRLARRLSLRLSPVPVTARLVAVARAIEASTGLANGEVRRLPLRGLSLGSRQRRTNERSMHGPLVVGTSRRRWFLALDRFGFFGIVHRFCRKNGSLVDRVTESLAHAFVGNDEHRISCLDRGSRDSSSRLLASRCRHLGVLVLVLGVTRGATRLLHVVFDHRDNRMIGDAALARTVVV